jgi:chaperonin GroEL
MLGEVLDIVGEYGWLDIRSGQGQDLEREYVEGAYWDGGVLSRQMLAGQPNLKVEMENAAILISDLEVEDPGQLVPVMNTALQAGTRSLLIVASKLSDSAIGLLQANRDPAKFQAIAVQAPASRADERATALEDLAVLTGGVPFLRAAGDTLGKVTLAELGRARRVWADRFHFGVVGAQGDPRRLRVQIASLREALGRMESNPSSLGHTPRMGDAEARRRLQQRIGKLMGGSAILWIGGTTESEITLRKELAQRTADALRGAVLDGVVPGGGVSLLACCSQLRRMLDQSTDPDERFAYRALLRAMEEPSRTIIANAGYDASEIMAEIRRAGPGNGFDAIAGQIVDVREAGILDVAAVQKAAVHSAISGAGLALTVDVLVRRKKPAVSMEPD